MLKTEISTAIIDYCQNHGASESHTLHQLRNATLKLCNSQMLITPIQGSLLKMLVQISGAQTILEVGMFTGYSALWMALGLPEDGKLITLDINHQHLALAEQHWLDAEVKSKIKPMIAPALISMQNLHETNHQFDLVFIDANKSEYIEYYEMALNLIKEGGIIIIDNVLMYGQVLENSPQKNYIKVLQELNELLRHDKRVDVCMLPIGDGLTIARKKELLK